MDIITGRAPPSHQPTYNNPRLFSSRGFQPNVAIQRCVMCTRWPCDRRLIGACNPISHPMLGHRPEPFHRTVVLHKPTGVVCARANTRQRTGRRDGMGRGAQPDQVSVFTVLAATGLSHQTMG